MCVLLLPLYWDLPGEAGRTVCSYWPALPYHSQRGATNGTSRDKTGVSTGRECDDQAAEQCGRNKQKNVCITLPMPHLVSISAVTLPTPPTPTTATVNVRIFCHKIERWSLFYTHIGMHYNECWYEWDDVCKAIKHFRYLEYRDYFFCGCSSKQNKKSKNKKYLIIIHDAHSL